MRQQFHTTRALLVAITLVMALAVAESLGESNFLPEVRLAQVIAR